MGLATDGFPPFQGFIKLWHLTQLWHLVKIKGSSPRQYPMPYNPIMQHSPCLPDIQTSFLQAVLQGINPPTHWVTTITFSYIDPNHQRTISSINLFIHKLCHSTQLPYMCIWNFIHFPDTQQTSEVVHKYSPNPRSLFIPQYHCLTTTCKNRHQQWFMQDPGTLKLQTSSIT